MKLTFPVNAELFEQINTVSNIIYQGEKTDFEDCEKITEDVMNYLHKEGILKTKEK